MGRPCGRVQVVLGALTLDGHVYRGAHGSAGELGHIVVEPHGELCDCGLTGCLETLIGDNALARRDLFDWAGQQLGDTLASLVHVFDPEDVVISGEGVEVWEFWEPGFTRSLRAHLWSHRRDLRVTVRNWGEDTWARGAASLVFASPFRSRRGVVVRTARQADAARRALIVSTARALTEARLRSGPRSHAARALGPTALSRPAVCSTTCGRSKIAFWGQTFRVHVPHTSCTAGRVSLTLNVPEGTGGA